MKCKPYKTSQGNSNTSKNTRSPRANLYQLTDGWSLQVALPGVSQEQVTLEAEGSTLRLSAEGELHHYQRSFRLPQGQDIDKINASLEAGVLTVQINANAPLKRQVEVQTA